ncbi:non-hydrolyzing UDP-N-acetylglucosamine 2-epimerase [Candidatus Magnetominusculus dajiuhuensis]|uniref:non-hydrolyzing UDP-N-acetylglucosamine 2-epimerase n=1 Tax=Candidatus Magnetominusculus dajiuhuensis TaxID=3137712 RepID=UPI003B42851C
MSIDKIKILLVFGTRPEAIKMAPVIRQLISRKSTIIPVVCITGQHREMLDQVMSVFDIKPGHDLGIMKRNQDLFDITINSLGGLKCVIEKEQPNIVLVQGDTTTAFTAALAAYYLKVPIGHVEAGLRTYNKYSPFPEEINRHLLSVLADLHFAPTAWAQSNLINEGIPADRIWVTGNTVIDALLSVSDRVLGKSTFWFDYFKDNFNLDLQTNIKKIILVTGHRRENFGEGFMNICMSLKEISQKRPDAAIIYPVHLNPNVQRPVHSILQGLSNIHLIDPVEYEPFVFLMNRAYFILTDSGGIQEEAPSLGKPVLVMRDSTERPEGVEAGVVKLVGTSRELIVDSALALLDDALVYERMSKGGNPYGDGKAAERIVDILAEKLSQPH